MVPGTYAESDTGETLRLDIGLELEQPLNKRASLALVGAKIFIQKTKTKKTV